MQEDSLAPEAKVVTENVNTAATPNTTQTPPLQPVQKKKKNPVLVIIMVLVGLAVLCCSCAIGGIFALNYGMQKTPQAVALKTLFTSLSEDDKEGVRSVATSRLYDDLYEPFNNNGDTLASLFKNNITDVRVSSVNIENSSARVEFKLEQKVEEITNLEYAKLEKIGDKWVVSYIGPKPDSSNEQESETDWTE